MGVSIRSWPGRIGVSCLAAVACTGAMAVVSAHAETAVSSNMVLVGRVDDPHGDLIGAMSIAFSRKKPFAFVNTRGAHSKIVTLDISEPTAPRIIATLDMTKEDGMAGMEDMNLGERPDGTAFLIVPTGSTADGRSSPTGFRVVDVTKPAEPKKRRTGAIAAHTWTCATVECYSAFGVAAPDSPVLDLHNLDNLDNNPESEPAGTVRSLVGPYGHDWNRDGAGVLWHVGKSGLAAYDVSAPTAPQPLNASDKWGALPPYNDQLQLHGTLRPNAQRFTPGTAKDAASVDNGDVLLVTEEGNDVDCTDTFQTWHIPYLDAARFRAENQLSLPSQGSITPLDTWSFATDTTPGVDRPVNMTYCSVHWFDFHQAGFVALAAYSGGTRILDVRDARHIREVGYYFDGKGLAMQSYWVPERDRAGQATGEASKLVYTTDVGPDATAAVGPTSGGGIDIFRVTLPR